MRQKEDYSYLAMYERGPEVTAYCFAKFMGMDAWRVKHLIHMGIIPARKQEDKWSRHGHKIMVPNPARDPKLVDAEWDQCNHKWIVLCPGMRSEGMCL